MNNHFVGQLVESWSKSFGRIIFILPNDTIVVKWSYRLVADYYSIEEQKALRFYNREETDYE